MTDTPEHNDAADIVFRELAWRPMSAYDPAITSLPVLIDDQGKLVLALQNLNGPAGSFLDRDMRSLDFVPTLWAEPTKAAIKYLAGNDCVTEERQGRAGNTV